MFRDSKSFADFLCSFRVTSELSKKFISLNAEKLFFNYFLELLYTAVEVKKNQKLNCRTQKLRKATWR